MLTNARLPLLCAFAALLNFFSNASSSASSAEPLSTRELQAHYRHLHQNPELSLQEAETSAYLARELEALGYSVTREVGGHGIVAVLANGSGPTALYRADMDALPVAEDTGLPYASKATGLSASGEPVPVMHACGHDVHMTVLLGAAAQMAARRDEWRGTLLLVGQPAEELGAGSQAMLADGLFERFGQPDYNLALHTSADLPVGSIGYTPGYGMANVDEVDVTIYGRGGHGAYPEKTIDPVVLAAEFISVLQTIVSRELSALEPAVISVGSIHGGSKHNIIPDEVKLQLTVRSYADETRDVLLRRIEEISHGLARTAGVSEERLPVVHVTDEYTPALYNTPEFAQRVTGILRASMGDTAVVQVKPSMAGEDFSRYGRSEARIPTTLLWLGGVSKADYRAAGEGKVVPPGLHSALFAPAADEAIPVGVEAMTTLLLELLAR